MCVHIYIYIYIYIYTHRYHYCTRTHTHTCTHILPPIVSLAGEVFVSGDHTRHPHPRSQIYSSNSIFTAVNRLSFVCM